MKPTRNWPEMCDGMLSSPNSTHQPPVRRRIGRWSAPIPISLVCPTSFIWMGPVLPSRTALCGTFRPSVACVSQGCRNSSGVATFRTSPSTRRRLTLGFCCSCCRRIS
eukprot:4876425-Prymnesium_polylepis.5